MNVVHGVVGVKLHYSEFAITFGVRLYVCSIDVKVLVDIK